MSYLDWLSVNLELILSSDLICKIGLNLKILALPLLIHLLYSNKNKNWLVTFGNKRSMISSAKWHSIWYFMKQISGVSTAVRLCLNWLIKLGGKTLAEWRWRNQTRDQLDFVWWNCNCYDGGILYYNWKNKFLLSSALKLTRRRSSVLGDFCCSRLPRNPEDWYKYWQSDSVLLINPFFHSVKLSIMRIVFCFV